WSCRRRRGLPALRRWTPRASGRWPERRRRGHDILSLQPISLSPSHLHNALGPALLKRGRCRLVVPNSGSTLLTIDDVSLIWIGSDEAVHDAKGLSRHPSARCA